MDFDYHTNIRRAQQGDKESLEKLSRAARERLGADVYRQTLDHDLTDEIVQEAILEMLKILNELKDADRFWPWLYKIALNKLRLHKRKELIRKTAVEGLAVNGGGSTDGNDAMGDMVGKELKEIVVRAMARLKSEHRAVITMRCYREMGYSVIGEAVGVWVKLGLFFRGAWRLMCS